LPGIKMTLKDTYEIVRMLKKTIFGTIELGFEKKTGQQVAVKISSCQKRMKKLEWLENPREEVRLMTLLNNKHEVGSKYVIKLLFAESDQENDWTVLEFAPKGDLFDVVSSAFTSGRLDVEKAKSLFIQIVEGIHFIHKCNISHLDLSLENILISDDNTVKICDFGLAREGANFKGSCERPGKIGYMCGEIYAQKDFNGHKADVWSAGVILFILLTGIPPYEIPSVTDERFRWVLRGYSGLTKMFRAWKIDWIPDEAIDLLSHMLTTQEKRWTSEQVLRHPWLASSTSSNLTSSSSSSSLQLYENLTESLTCLQI